MDKQIVVVLSIVIYVFIRSFIIEPNSLNITNYEIENNQLQGIRVAFLSDFHLKKHDYKRLDKIIVKTNRQQPDLVILGGDYAYGHSENQSMNPDIIAQKLSLINAPIYGVLGENDWKVNGRKIADAFGQNHIRILENASRRIIIKRRYIDIIGLADYNTRTVKIRSAMLRTGLPRIVISHHPDVYYDVIDKVSIILAGHTHGGQFILPFTRPMFVSSKFGADFASGVINKSQNTMIVSRGLGTTGIPARLNCEPEIVIVDFVKVGTARKVKKRR